MTQSTDDILAALTHHMAQLERRAEAAEKELELKQLQLSGALSRIEETRGAFAAERAQLEETRAERRALCDLLSADPSTIAGMTLVEGVAAIQTHLTEVVSLARAVCDSAARQLNYSADILLVSTAALRQLGKAVRE